MIEINLLRQDKADSGPRRKLDFTKPLIYAGLIVGVTGAAAFNLKLHFEVTDIRRKVADLDRQMNDPEFINRLNEAERLDEELTRFNRKQVIIEDLIKNRIHWSKKLAALRDSLPTDIWIEEIQLEEPKGTNIDHQTLTLEAATLNEARGFAMSAKTMDALLATPEFMEGLAPDIDDTQGIKEAWFKSQQDDPIGQTNIWRFSLEARRPLPESEKKKK